MELKSCSLFGRCRNKDTGEFTKISLLHRDLLGLGKISKSFNRLKANRAFYLSLNPKFLERYLEDLVFTSEDADSEPKLASFFEAARLAMPEVKLSDIRELLAKKFGEGVYSYEDALNRVTKFNKEGEGGTSFIGTLVPQPNGQYQFKITYNSALEQEALMQAIADRKNAEAIIQQLENQKIGIAEGAKSVYDTKGPKVLSNGLLGLITLKEGKEGAAYNIKELASETGHAIIGMLGKDNKFVLRLESIVTKNPEVVRQLLGDLEYSAYEGSENATREFMGHIVGLYLEQWENIKPDSTLKSIGNLILRMVDWITSKLHFTNRDYYTSLYKAKWAAYDMVKGFMGYNFQGSLDNALRTPETLLGNMEVVYSHLNTSILKLHELLESSKDYGYRVHKNYKDEFHKLISDLHELRLLRQENTTRFLEEQIEENAAEALMNLLRFLGNEFAQTKTLLERAKDGYTPSGEALSLSEQARIVRYSQEVLNMATQTLALVKYDYQYITLDEIKNELLAITEQLENIVNNYEFTDAGGRKIHGSYLELINEARTKIALKLLVQLNGNEFIAVSLYVHRKGLKIVRSKAQAKHLQDALMSNTTTSWVSTLIDSIADNPDIVNQMVYDIVELKKHEANVKTLDIKDRLFEMYRDLRKLGISDTRKFFEVDSLGHITGNIISERNWGEWERIYLEDKEKFNNDFWEHNLHLFPSMSDMFNNTMYLTAFGAWREGWHKEHSVLIEVKDEDGNTVKYADGKVKKAWAPVIHTDNASIGKPFDFYNNEWETVTSNPEVAEWLKNYKKLKRELDALLPEGCTNAFGVRAPQFMGTTTDRLSNAFKGDGSIRRVAGVSLRKLVIHNVLLSPDDIEFGGELDTYNNADLYSQGSTIFTRAHSNALKNIERVPLYGVRKLSNLDDLSTDLILSTLAYASMATSYNSLMEVADVVTQIAYAKKRGKDTSTVLASSKKINLGPASYARLADYILMQVFNNYQDPYMTNDTYHKAFRKLAGLMGRLGSVWMLGFNVHSALTNAFTGFNEIVKEATAGEEYNLIDFSWAAYTFAKLWFGGFLLNVCNIALRKGSIIESNTKLDLFSRLFNVLNDAERKFRDYHVQTTGYGLMLGWSYTNLCMLPYSITDLWMLAMSFLASARHTKLYNKTTDEECSLWDAYVIKREEGKNPKLVLKDNPEDWMIYDKNLAELNKILHDKKLREGGLSTAEMLAIYKYLKVSVIDPNTGEVKTHIEPVRDIITGEPVFKDDYVPYNSDLENRFRLRCRAINNRLHGVYNRGDGGAYEKLAIASMLASMKKYAIGLIDRRFSVARYDYRTKEMRLGSVVTMTDLLVDCFTTYSTGDSGEFIKTMDELEWKKGLYIVGTTGKLIYGLLKFAYITTFPFARMGVDNYLRKRGYSENLITNVRRFWGDQITPLLIKLAMSLVVPPDKDDDEQKIEDPLFPEISKLQEKAYLTLLRHSIFGDATINDEKFLTEKHLERTTRKHSKSVPFSVKGIIYYQLYRGLLELEAYNFPNTLAMFVEYKGLTDSSLPGLTAFYDFMFTVGAVAENVSEEELLLMKPKERKNYHNGRQVYTRGDNRGYYKYIKKLLKVGPTRTGETWLNGYASQESMQHFKDPKNLK